MGVSAHQVLDELVKLFHIFIQIGLDLQDLLIQSVVAISSMAAANLLNRKAQIVLRTDLLVNSNSFHQG